MLSACRLLALSANLLLTVLWLAAIAMSLTTARLLPFQIHPLRCTQATALRA
jgi:hypothetical protein